MRDGADGEHMSAQLSSLTEPSVMGGGDGSGGGRGGQGVGEADIGLFSKTCPPSQTKKHSLPRRPGAKPAHSGIITRHLLKFDIIPMWWAVWGLR